MLDKVGGVGQLGRPFSVVNSTDPSALRTQMVSVSLVVRWRTPTLHQDRFHNRNQLAITVGVALTNV